METNGSSKHRVQKIEEAIQQIDSIADPQLRATVIQLVQSLMDLHSDAFNRTLEIVSEREDGQACIDLLGADELVGGLLVLYGLHPVDFDSRIRQALENVRPLLQSHGGNVELLGLSDGVVRLQMVGSCHSCPSSASTLKGAIEEAIYATAPDTVELIVAGVVEEQPSSSFVSIQRNRPAHAAQST